MTEIHGVRCGDTVVVFVDPTVALSQEDSENAVDEIEQEIEEKLGVKVNAILMQGATGLTVLRREELGT